jgi:NAD(P)-dependent dehydrogenase (short-subunit alcohol dehydrogenase family)
VRLFANEGARVSFCSRSEQPGLDLERELKGKGRDVIFSRCDAAIEKEAMALVKSTLDRYGGIDLLVNNAAVSKLVPVEEMSLADWELILTKNLTSMFLMSRESIPALKHHQSGIDLCRSRSLGVSRLRLDQGRSGQLLENARPRTRARRHPRQCALSRRDRDETLPRMA